MNDRLSVCVIGAGPYGLSVAAHLRSSDIDVRVFGIPMRRWLSQMPRTNFLKSEGCGSSLSDPNGYRTLEQYCSSFDLDYSAYGFPVPRRTFVDYGLWFQRELVPDVEPLTVERLERLNGGYELNLSSGECARAESIVIATGMDCMAFTPEELISLPGELRSHSVDHVDFSQFKGMKVAVVGSGQSALETAAELHDVGAQVHLVVRRRSIIWNASPLPRRRPMYQRFRWPRTPLGDGLQAWLHCNAPGLFHELPERVRIHRVASTHGPAGAWWLRDRLAGHFPILLGRNISAAERRGRQIALKVVDSERGVTEVLVDHVIACTGYRFDLQKLPFLSQSLKRQLRCEERSPKLSSHFESSASGLYFTGLASAYSFGPAMRFVFGSHYTAGAISRHLSHRFGVRTPTRRPSYPKCPES